MGRAERARPVLAKQRQRWRKRYAVLVAAILISAFASAAEWPAASPAQQGVKTAPFGSGLTHAVYTAPPSLPPIHPDAQEAWTANPTAHAFFATGSDLDRARAEQCLTMAIYYEAATEPDNGQRAVAQVVLNRVAHPSYPNTVCGVVFQGSERSTGCQFTFACDGSLARRPAASWWERARRVARAALAGAVYAPVGLATSYHTQAIHPWWADSLVPVTTIGAHRFYRLPGAAGERAAFRVAYLGGEPEAAPHPRVYTPAPASDPDPVALARAYEAALPRTIPLQAQHAAAPVYAPAVQARGGEALFHADNLPAAGKLSPELERSGQWLRQP